MGLIVAEVLLQIACAYHAYRNGNAQPWLFIILLFPLIGSIVYIVAVVLPDFVIRAKRISSRPACAS